MCVCAYSKNKTLAIEMSSASERKKCTKNLMIFIKDFMRTIIFLFIFFCTVHATPNIQHPFLLVFIFSSLAHLHLLYSVWYWFGYFIMSLWWYDLSSEQHLSVPDIVLFWWVHKIYHYLRLKPFESQCWCDWITKCETDKIKIPTGSQTMYRMRIKWNQNMNAITVFYAISQSNSGLKEKWSMSRTPEIFIIFLCALIY